MADAQPQAAPNMQKKPQNKAVAAGAEGSLPPPAPEQNSREAEDAAQDTGIKTLEEGILVLNNAYIFVMNGVHEGATFKVSGDISIGSDFENDMILTDETIESQHVAMSPYETQLGFGIRVVCKGEHILINGERILTKDQDTILTETFVLTLGDISLNVHVNSAGMVSTAYKKFVQPQIDILKDYHETVSKTLTIEKFKSDIRNIIVFVLGAIIVTGIIAIYSMGESKKPPLRGHYKEHKELIQKKKQDTSMLRQQATSDLAKIIKQYGLAGRITVRSDETTIYVKGRINSYENSKWIKVQNWYDSAYGAFINLVSLLQVRDGLRRTISFKAVVTEGRMPYVVSWTGDRYRPGATLPGGWIIEKIDNIGVHVRDAVENRLFVVEHIRSQRGPQNSEPVFIPSQ